MKAEFHKTKHIACTALFQALLVALAGRCTAQGAFALPVSAALCSGLCSVVFLFLAVAGARGVSCASSDGECSTGSRYAHCFVCDVCVCERDHHCAWLGTCIGRDNRVFFVAYLAASACSLLSLLHALPRTSPLWIPVIPVSAVFTTLSLYHAAIALLNLRSSEIVGRVRRRLFRAKSNANYGMELV